MVSASECQASRRRRAPASPVVKPAVVHSPTTNASHPQPCASHQAHQAAAVEPGEGGVLDVEDHGDAQGVERVGHEQRPPTGRGARCSHGAPDSASSSRSVPNSRTNQAPSAVSRLRTGSRTQKPTARPIAASASVIPLAAAARPARPGVRPPPNAAGRTSRIDAGIRTTRQAGGLAEQPGPARHRLREEHGELVGFAVRRAQPEQQRRERQAVEDGVQHPQRRRARRRRRA